MELMDRSASSWCEYATDIPQGKGGRRGSLFSCPFTFSTISLLFCFALLPPITLLTPLCSHHTFCTSVLPPSFGSHLNPLLFMDPSNRRVVQGNSSPTHCSLTRNPQCGFAGRHALSAPIPLSCISVIPNRKQLWKIGIGGCSAEFAVDTPNSNSHR